MVWLPCKGAPVARWTGSPPPRRVGFAAREAGEQGCPSSNPHPTNGADDPTLNLGFMWWGGLRALPSAKDAPPLPAIGAYVVWSLIYKV